MQESLSPTTPANSEPFDPANPVEEPTHDTAVEAETTQLGSTVEPQTERGAVNTTTVIAPIYSQYTPKVTMGARDHTEQEGAAQEGDRAQVQELPQVPLVQEFGMAQAIPVNESPVLQRRMKVQGTWTPEATRGACHQALRQRRQPDMSSLMRQGGR